MHKLHLSVISIVTLITFCANVQSSVTETLIEEDIISMKIAQQPITKKDSYNNMYAAVTLTEEADKLFSDEEYDESARYYLKAAWAGDSDTLDMLSRANPSVDITKLYNTKNMVELNKLYEPLLKYLKG